MRSSSVWQEAKAIPLPAYVLTVAALLAAPWLLVNHVFEPRKAEGSVQAATPVAPRTTTGPAQNTAGAARTTRAAERQYASAEASAPDQESGTDESARKSAKKTQGRSGQGANRDSRHSSYAQTAPTWRSPAEGTLGPH
jgi:hypothetical protein